MYAIKNAQYVEYVAKVDNQYYFSFTKNINEAIRFESITEIINTLVVRGKKNPSFTYDYTIVRLKEVSTPRYEEVIL